MSPLLSEIRFLNVIHFKVGPDGKLVLPRAFVVGEQEVDSTPDHVCHSYHWAPVFGQSCEPSSW